MTQAGPAGPRGAAASEVVLRPAAAADPPSAPAHRFRPAPGGPAAVAGWGTAIPARRVTNHDLAQRVDTSDAWIVERTGIRERRFAGPGETTTSLAIEAGAAAITSAGLEPADIGCCIVATCTPEQPIPATAAFVQDGLGLRCGAFDLDAACAGFVYALVVGAGLLSTGGLDAVLLVGSETLSRVADPDDRATCVLFGDGAGAVVLVPGEPAPPLTGPRRPTGPAPGGANAGLLAWDLGCDGSAASLLAVPAGGSRLPPTPATVAEGQHFLKMEGQEVFRRAVRAIVDSAAATMEQVGVTAAEVDLFVPHQANVRIIDAAATRLGIPAERTFVNIDRYGNTSAASIPIALAEAADSGRLNHGDLVLMSGFGAGMSWASALLRW
ncbi:MAG TPA: beta-ketoacyl-ACP synthase III [Acidimicrobiales bacterium]|nr:beta-ketoacyl-ACP synthase III [Acidimicrobiales bacterium]